MKTNAEIQRVVAYGRKRHQILQHTVVFDSGPFLNGLC